MRPQLLMFDEVQEWDDLKVRVVIESDGKEYVGNAVGSIERQSRLATIGEATLAAAHAALGKESVFRLDAVQRHESPGHEYVVAVVVETATGDPLVGAAPLRAFEEPGQVATRAVLDAVNRHLTSH